MKKVYTGLVVALFTAIAIFPLRSTAQISQQEKKERIQASYMLAFGRAPQQGELNHWMSQIDQTIPQLLSNHRQYAAAEKSFKRALVIKSYNDALGRNPNEDEIRYWTSGNDVYVDLTNKHVQWLAANTGEYEKVIKRSYQFALNRQPDASELNYWKGQGTLSYIVLVGCHEQWKRTNGQTAKKTGGSSSLSSSAAVQTVNLSSKIASEAKSAAGINVGGNVISAGGGNVVSAGGLNVIAVGGGNVISVGGLN